MDQPGVYPNKDGMDGNKILRCYNMSTNKWYPTLSKIYVPPGARIVVSRQSLQHKTSKSDDPVQDDELRTSDIKIVDIEKWEHYDKCYPLFSNTLVHSNFIEYRIGESYTTDLDVDYNASFRLGFYFKKTRESMEKDMESAESVIKNSSLSLYSDD
jgi:hypothetical protein